MKSNDNTTAWSRIADQVVQEVRQEWQHVKAKTPEWEEAFKDRFEDMKAAFRASLKEVRNEMNDWKEDGKESLASLQEKLAVLEKQLQTARAESYSVIEEESKRILEYWHALRNRIEDRPEFQKLRDELKEDWMSWRVKMDLLRVKFNLGKLEAEDSWKRFQEVFEERKQELKSSIEQGAGIAAEKLNAFEKELETLVQRIRKA